MTEYIVTLADRKADTPCRLLELTLPGQQAVEVLTSMKAAGIIGDWSRSHMRIDGTPNL